jgi:hypothetical protein
MTPRVHSTWQERVVGEDESFRQRALSQRGVQWFTRTVLVSVWVVEAFVVLALGSVLVRHFTEA